METKSDYNGWTNYETWCVNLWLDNDRGTHDAWRERAGEILDLDAGALCRELYGDDKSAILREGVHACVLADILKDEHEEEACAVTGARHGDASVFSDLLGAALQSVNWHEIAEHLIDAAREAREYAAKAVQP